MRLFTILCFACHTACAASEFALETRDERLLDAGTLPASLDTGASSGGGRSPDGGLAASADGGQDPGPEEGFAVYDAGYNLADHSDQHPCAQLCRRPQRGVCGLDFLDDENRCVATCMGRIGQMLPAAQQAWLRCGLDRCQADRPIDCHPAHFMGPQASHTCLQAALLRQACEPERYEPLWRDLWECEALRSPKDQPSLGGDFMVQCMAEQQACGFAGFYQCLLRSRDRSDRRDAIREACAQAERCGPEVGGQCLMALVGLTTSAGEQRVSEVGRCLEGARGHCPDIQRCLAPERDLGQQAPAGDPCVEACGRCEEGSSPCVEHCLSLRQSLSLSQGTLFGACLSTSRCDGQWPLEGCLSLVLPQIAEDCAAFEGALIQTCGGTGSDALAERPQVRWLQCALSGLRSGVMTGEELSACLARVGCVDDPVGRCLRGGSH